MDLLMYSYDTTLVQADDRVIEVFHRLVTGSLRVPLPWAGVSLAPNRKGDQIQVWVGVSSNDGGAFYDPNVTHGGPFGFTVPSSEESRLREFFDQVAGRAGRTT